MVAAVTARAFDAATELAPAGVDVRRLPDGRDHAAFVLPDWQDRELIDALPQLERLRVVQALSAGTDWIEARVPAWATLCNARGARDAAVAEWVVGALLGDAYGQFTAARTRRWSDAKPRELQGTTVLIVGFGAIGRAVSRRLEPFGVTVIGVARHARDGVHATGELPALVEQADAVVVLAPLTCETRGLVDAAVLARMRDGALLVNAGRGGVVDTGALVAELEAGRLRAVLDVVDPEPLPDDHPLWETALAITPHNAGDTGAADERAVRFGAEQLVRFARGEPLLNVVREGAYPDRSMNLEGRR
jgi:phosphoglycerate dehydrogenase-like enzyme